MAVGRRKQSPRGTPASPYSQADLAEVSDNPELTRDELKKAQPFAKAFPELAESLRRARGKQKAPTKQLISIRLDRDVLEVFKATGDGWQGRINDTLRAHASRLPTKRS